MRKTILILVIILFITGCNFISNNKDLEKSTNLNEESSLTEEIINSTQEEVSTNYTYTNFNSSYDSWYNTTLQDKYVLTVIGASYCSHCMNFKPIIETIAEENSIDLYYFYIDQLDESEANKITTAYETNYKGSVPHLFIIKNGNVVTNSTGEMTSDSLIEFLKLNSVIK